MSTCLASYSVYPVDCVACCRMNCAQEISLLWLLRGKDYDDDFDDAESSDEESEPELVEKPTKKPVRLVLVECLGTFICVTKWWNYTHGCRVVFDWISDSVSLFDYNSCSFWNNRVAFVILSPESHISHPLLTLRVYFQQQVLWYWSYMVTWNITYHDLWISGGGVVYWLMLWLHSTKIIDAGPS